jgi:hypothetical protein
MNGKADAHWKRVLYISYALMSKMKLFMLKNTPATAANGKYIRDINTSNADLSYY